MKYFAKLGIGNLVEKVEVLSDNIATSEQVGVEFLRNLYNDSNSQWFQTYKDESLRKNFASVNYKYDKIRDAFIPPKPFNSWTLNETTCQWEAPVAYPDDGQRYSWNETNQIWDLV